MSGLAKDYESKCAMPRLAPDTKSPRKTPTRTTPSFSGCDVYVWGSNSSHQLAEGSTDKITIPKLANAFENVQMVEALLSYGL